MRFVRHTAAGLVGALVGWVVFEPWSGDYGLVRESLLLYAVGFGIAVALVAHKYLYARKRDEAVGVLRHVPLYVLPAVGVLAVQILFAAEEVAVGEDLVVEERLMLLDISSSMDDSDMRELRRAATTYLELLQASSSRDEVGLVTFSDDAYLVHSPTADYAELMRSVGSLRSSGGTNMSAAFGVATEVFGVESSRPREIILVSDGQPDEPYQVLELVTAMSDVVVHSVAAGGDADERFLEAVATEAGGDFYRAANVSQLTDALGEIARRGITRDSSSEDTQFLPVWRRILGWALFGLIVGLTVGWLSKVQRRRMVLVGTTGGALGGAVSALLFVAVDQLALGGSASRAVSFGLLGTLLGVSIFLVGELYTKIAPGRSTPDFGRGPAAR